MFYVHPENWGRFPILMTIFFRWVDKNRQPAVISEGMFPSLPGGSFQLVSGYIVTPIYKPFSPFGRGITLARGLTITMVINNLLTGMILQAPIQPISRRWDVASCNASLRCSSSSPAWPKALMMLRSMAERGTCLDVPGRVC